ncbi:MAG: Spy/CpxP family protein refolding chaperone [Xanthobacteraceae bacterium]
MRTLGAIFGITALAAVAFSSPPAAAFGFRLGPLHFGLPFVGHHYHRHRLYMRANPREARIRPNDIARSESGSSKGATSALLYPSIALPSIIENIFFPTYSSPWPFDYQAIFTTAFAKALRQDPSLCQPSFDPSAAIGRISNGVMLTADQSQLLQRLGGALGAASGYLAKSCSKEIPAQPVARLQLMESQLEELSMALNIVRQSLLDFEQSLNADQQSRLAVASSQGSLDRQTQSGNIAGGCGSLSAIDWSINEINQSVQPTTAQRDALDDVRLSFNDAARDLEAHCPTTIPATALNRLDTIQARLDSTWRATLSIQVSLANFEAELNDAQKIRFDTMNFAARGVGSGH